MESFLPASHKYPAPNASEPISVLAAKSRLFGDSSPIPPLSKPHGIPGETRCCVETNIVRSGGQEDGEIAAELYKQKTSPEGEAREPLHCSTQATSDRSSVRLVKGTLAGSARLPDVSILSPPTHRS